MAEFLSWHKPGQKVVAIDDDKPWKNVVNGRVVSDASEPKPDCIYEISEVVHLHGYICFALIGFDDLYDADDFRPVYPQSLDELRRLCAPSPQRAKENA